MAAAAGSSGKCGNTTGACQGGTVTSLANLVDLAARASASAAPAVDGRG